MQTWTVQQKASLWAPNAGRTQWGS